jgi:tetratricopeptide (TPR) repeat protein
MGKEPRLANWVSRTLLRRDASPSDRPQIDQAISFESRGKYEAALELWRTQEDSPRRTEALRRLELRLAVDHSNAGNWIAAVHRLLNLWRSNPSDSEVQRELELAADCGAREAQTEHRWDDASAMWYVCRTLSLREEQKSRLAAINRNLHQCALKGARTAETDGHWEDAMQFWEYLRAVDTFSAAATKGIERAAHFFVSELGRRAAVPARVFTFEDPFGLLPQLWQVEVLSRLGRAHEASHRLFEIEAQGGRTPHTRYQRALICLNLGRYTHTVEAANESISMSPGDKTGYRHVSECAYLAAEALCAEDQHVEARKLLMQHFRGREMLTDADFQALFSTVRTRIEIEEVRKFLEPAFAPNSGVRLSALKQYSIALRDLGYTDEAVMVARERLLDGITRQKFGQTPRFKLGGWSSVAKLALLDLKTDLDSGGFEFFLTGGTLLGCIREQDILKHDSDIDVGMMPGPSIASVQQLLRSTGHFRIKPLPAGNPSVRVIHANGASIDLFWHWMEDGKFVHQGQKTKWWNTPFTLTPHPFLGATFNVPSDPDLCLSENYEDWRVPMTAFDTFVDTPNMIVADRQHLVWYFYSRLYDYYVWGQRVQFKKVWQAVQDLTKVDSELAAKISTVVEAIESPKTGEHTGR